MSVLLVTGSGLSLPVSYHNFPSPGRVPRSRFLPTHALDVFLTYSFLLLALGATTFIYDRWAYMIVGVLVLSMCIPVTLDTMCTRYAEPVLASNPGPIMNTSTWYLILQIPNII